MAILTVRLSDRLKRHMKRLRHVNWSQIVRGAIEERMRLELTQEGRDRLLIQEASRSID